jgi:peptidoglycan pentaglycine glycine transferase (the first glycine)
MPEVAASQWDVFLAGCPDAHVLQTSDWGKLKLAFGWQPAYVLSPADENRRIPAIGALILFRSLPLGMKLAYIPKGPVSAADGELSGPAWEHFIREVDTICRAKRAFMLKIEPDAWEAPADGGAASNPVPPGFRLSNQDIQPARTLLVDLCGDEEAVLARMKQKTRYNIRLAMKKGIVVYPSDDLEIFQRLMAVTGNRDGFAVHSKAYYQRAYDLFHPVGQCVLLVAAYESEPLAAMMVFARGVRAWYFYGASSNEQRERMPTYLMQWEAMRWARAQSCAWYDLWGVPDADEQTLEADFAERSDGLWGVYRFKRGFGGELHRAKGPWDRVYNPVLYAFYRWWVSRRESRD